MSLCSFRVSAKPQLDSQQEFIKTRQKSCWCFFLDDWANGNDDGCALKPSVSVVGGYYRREFYKAFVCVCTLEMCREHSGWSWGRSNWSQSIKATTYDDNDDHWSRKKNKNFFDQIYISLTVTCPRQTGWFNLDYMQLLLPIASRRDLGDESWEAQAFLFFDVALLCMWCQPSLSPRDGGGLVVHISPLFLFTSHLWVGGERELREPDSLSHLNKKESREL